jgi:hypothetical protein
VTILTCGYIWGRVAWGSFGRWYVFVVEIWTGGLDAQNKVVSCQQTNEKYWHYNLYELNLRIYISIINKCHILSFIFLKSEAHFQIIMFFSVNFFASSWDRFLFSRYLASIRVMMRFFGAYDKISFLEIASTLMFWDVMWLWVVGSNFSWTYVGTFILVVCHLYFHFSLLPSIIIVSCE